MTKLFTVATCLLLLAGSTKAKEWRGLVPSISTRADVIRIFQQCSDMKPVCEFNSPGQRIRIEFSGAADGGFFGCSTQLRPDTVLLIEVVPDRSIGLRAFAVKNRLRAFKLHSPGSANSLGYINPQEGLVLRTYGKRVIQIDYIPGEQARNICPSYYEKPQSFVENVFMTHAPAIAVICPAPGQLGIGAMLEFSAYAPATSRKVPFLWEVSAGKIVDGQGTHKIRVDSTGVQSRAITATVSLAGVASSCEAQLTPAALVLISERR